MQKKGKTKPTGSSELEELRERLQEVESTLNAIRSGEMDAIVVNGSRGTQVFTLETGDQPYRVMAESMSEGAATVTIDGTILFCNRRFAAMLGRAAEKLVGSSLLGHIAGFDFSCLCQLLRDGLEGTFRKEVNLVRNDGSQTPVLLSLDKLSLGESGDGICLVATDLTLQKQQMAELQRAHDEIRQFNRHLEQRVKERTADLSSAVKELEAFSYAVSHDLRAPLRAIDGFSRILMQDHLSELNDDGKHCLQIVRQSTQRMGDLIDALLAFSRLGRRSPGYRFVDMGEVVRGTVEELQGQHTNRKLQFTVSPLPKCLADPVLLRQVFLNLLSNAVKYTRTRELAVIEVGAANFGKLEQLHGSRGTPPEPGLLDPDTPVFYVRDNGVGFNMQYADRLFGIFQRLHPRDEFEGTGVGLAVVRRIVQKHGGQIWAYAKPDEGATFFFTLGATPIECDAASVLATVSAE